MLGKKLQQIVAHPPGLILIIKILEILETTCDTLQVVDEHTVRPGGLFLGRAFRDRQTTPRAKR